MITSVETESFLASLRNTCCLLEVGEFLTSALHVHLRSDCVRFTTHSWRDSNIVNTFFLIAVSASRLLECSPDHTQQLCTYDNFIRRT